MRTLSTCSVAWLVLSVLTWIGVGFSWLVPVASALTIGVLYVAGAASRARGWPLFWLLAALYGGIAVINIQVESLAFGISSPAVTLRDTLIGLAEVALVSALLTIGVTRDTPAETRPPADGLPRRLWLRVSVVAVSYIVLYSVAGSLILPFVRHFYATSRLLVMPPLGLLLGVQFLRGTIYAVSLVPLIRRMAGRRLHAALVAGLALSVLGGIFPLLLPVDDVLPADVRGVHMLEIFGSNFALGVIAAFVLVKRAASPRRVGAVATPA